MSDQRFTVPVTGMYKVEMDVVGRPEYRAEKIEERPLMIDEIIDRCVDSVMVCALVSALAAGAIALLMWCAAV